MVILCHVKEYIYCILKIDSSRPVKLLLLPEVNPQTTFKFWCTVNLFLEMSHIY